jgi:sulfite exporter TauE/SafE
MWWTAILIGFAGSLHCAGMCSPLVLAVTAHNPFLQSKVVYNTGRILVYAVLGSFAAAIGSLLPFQIQQSGLSLFMGIVFLLLGLGILKSVRIPYLDKYGNRFVSVFKHYFRNLLTQKGIGTFFVLGALNGLLPCGLTYMALAYCFVLPSAAEGFLFMLFFGLGTWPVMIGFTWLVRELLSNFNFSYRKVSAGLLLLAGILLIARVLVPNHGSEAKRLRAADSIGIIECK